MLATVLGQDLEAGDDGRFRIARKVAKDRVISTVDPDTRHGHKTQARGFDGYKGHVAVDPDSEIITDTTVTPGNAGDASVATDLIDDLLADDEHGDDAKVYGDSAYGTGEFQQHLDDDDIASGCRTQPPSAPAGRFAKDRFAVDLDDDTVTCPAGVTVSIRRGVDGDGIAYFAEHCTTCPLRAQCTNATAGRTISVNDHEAALGPARQRQQDPDWQADYRATRPKVERKLAHLMRRRHGGRRARVRGQPQSRRRLQPPRRRRQPRPPRRARTALHPHRMGRHHMTRPVANRQDQQRNSHESPQPPTTGIRATNSGAT